MGCFGPWAPLTTKVLQSGITNLSNIVAVSGGDYNSIALRTDGTVWKWGLNDVGELGVGDTDHAGIGPGNDSVAHPLPLRVTNDIFGNGFSNVVKVSNPDYHNIAVKADGSVWMWGANDQGQCGVGTTNNVLRPTPVSGLGVRVGLPLKVTASAPPGQASLAWPSATGEFFSIEFTTNLATGFSGTLQANILATPPSNVVTVPMTNADGFYRLKF